MIPIPSYQQKHEVRNFSLSFTRFSGWEEFPKMKAPVEVHSGKANVIIKYAETELKNLHTRQRKVLKSIADNGGFYIEITARLATPYVSGLGVSHPTEAGMILDRNTGLPYIPASSIKGVLRLAHALDIAATKESFVPNKDGEYEISDREPTMRKYFGDTKTDAEDAVRGQLVFLDAFPATLPKIKKDIMNPHFGGYYKGDTPPVETENPIPVMFMSVEEGVDFRFRAYASPLADGASAKVSNQFNDDDREALLAMFRRAGSEIGFGAKTAVGYGRMTNLRDSLTEMTAEWQKIRENDEIVRFPWRPALRELEVVANLGDFRQKGLEKAILADNKTNPEVFNAIYAKAIELRRNWNAENKEKYDPIISAWLQPSGLSWPPAENQAADTPNEAAAELERIKGITKWADYVTAPANVEILSKKGLKWLKDQLEIWGCKDKNAKDDKKTAWEELKRAMAG